MEPTAKSALAAATLIAFLILTACDERNDGPAEQAGEKVDEAAEDMQEKTEEVGDKVEQATD